MADEKHSLFLAGEIKPVHNDKSNFVCWNRWRGRGENAIVKAVIALFCMHLFLHSTSGGKGHGQPVNMFHGFRQIILFTRQKWEHVGQPKQRCTMHIKDARSLSVGDRSLSTQVRVMVSLFLHCFDNVSWVTRRAILQKLLYPQNSFLDGPVCV